MELAARNAQGAQVVAARMSAEEFTLLRTSAAATAVLYYYKYYYIARAALPVGRMLPACLSLHLRDGFV